MSVDILHVIAAILFLSVWISVTLLLRSMHAHELRESVQEQDGFY